MYDSSVHTRVRLGKSREAVAATMEVYYWYNRMGSSIVNKELAQHKSEIVGRSAKD